MRMIVGICWLLAPGPLRAQEPNVPNRAPTPAAFVPPGYRIIRDVAGHLNGDEYRDVVLVIGDTREQSDSTIEDLNPRVLLVLAGDSAGFHLDAANRHAVLGKDEGGTFDPFDDLSLDRNVIVLRHYGGSAWRWRYTHRFRYQGVNLQLIGRTTLTYVNASFCPRLKEYRPTIFDDRNLLSGLHHSYRVPADRCLKRERTNRLKPTTVLFRDFDIRKDIGLER